MKCYRKNGSDPRLESLDSAAETPSMKCYRKNGSDVQGALEHERRGEPSMKCYRKNGSDQTLTATECVITFPQ